MKSPPFFFCCSLFYTLHRLVVFGVPAVRAGGLVYVAVRCGAVLGLVDKLGDALTVRAGGFWQVFAGFCVLVGWVRLTPVDNKQQKYQGP